MADSRHELNERQKHHDVTSEDEVSYSSSPTRPTKTRRKAIIEWPWILECLFLALAIGALAALVAVILSVKDDSLGSWRDRHPHVSINTIVAILSTLLAGSCMFVVGQVMGQSKWQWFREPHSLADFARVDRASRGPWGSLLLLCRLRAPTLARVAAITTLVTVAVNPFAQNIIATQECQVASADEEMTIPTADAYFGYAGLKQRNTNPFPGEFTLWGEWRHAAHTDMKASVYSGVWGVPTPAVSGPIINTSSSMIEYNFPHRHYPRYTTLGVCHACADISSSIEKTCDSANPEDNGGAFSPHCKWSLPTEQSLNNYAGSDVYRAYMNDNISDISMNFAMVNSTASTLALLHVPGTFTNVTFLVNATTDPDCTTRGEGIKYCNDGSGVPNFELQTIAAECSLFPCARTYTTALINGSLVETEVKRSVGGGDWLGSVRQNQTKYPLDIIIDPEENCTSTKWSTDTRKYETYPCTFKAPATWIMSLGDFFWGFWNGTVAGRYFQAASPTNDVLDAFYQGGFTNFTHIDRMFGDVADSMTATIRKNGELFGPMTRYGGLGQGLVTRQVMKVDACIEPRWGWIAVPAAVVLATAVLLLWAIVGSRAATGRPVWKASALPVLFHGPHTTSLVGGKRLSHLKEMENKASGMVVKLSDGAAGNARLETCSS